MWNCIPTLCRQRQNNCSAYRTHLSNYKKLKAHKQKKKQVLIKEFLSVPCPLKLSPKLAFKFDLKWCVRDFSIVVPVKSIEGLLVRLVFIRVQTSMDPGVRFSNSMKQSTLFIYYIYLDIVANHTWYLSQTPQTCLCKKKLPSVNFYRFNAKNLQFTVCLLCNTQ